MIRTHMPLGQAYPDASTPPADYSAYDQAGNLTGYQLDNPSRKMFSVTRNYYGADEKLRASERWSCYVNSYSYYSHSNVSGFCQPMYQLDNSNAGAYEEYRYDALGRRIAVRTRREPFCTSASCASTLARTVWDGDQILYEMRAKGGDSESAATLENDGETGSYWGRVAYTHGGGIDQPLDLIRMGYTLPDSTGYGFNDWGGPYPILPFANWRGNIDAATTARGQKMPCQNLCTVNIHLPGDEYQAYFSPRDLISRQSWFGSLIENKLDGTGQMYMRNRYFNPGTGTFTQSDPIGIAGGLNTYGFAEGDPVFYNDPYGLCAEYLVQKNGLCPGGMNHEEYNAVEDAIGTLNAGREQSRLTQMLEHGRIRKVANTASGRPAQSGFSRIEVTEGFFTGNQAGFETGYDTPGERGWVLGHELGHIVQWETGKLVADQDNPNVPRDRARIRALFFSQAKSENAVLQGDANLLGCRLATQPGTWAALCQ